MRNSIMWNRMSIALAALVAGVVFANGAALAASVEKGKIAYVKYGCWQCHGFLGQGSLITSGGTVIGPSRLTYEAFAGFTRNTSGTMPPYREAVLPNADLADIYAYLQTMPKPPDPNSIPLLKP